MPSSTIAILFHVGHNCTTICNLFLEYFLKTNGVIMVVCTKIEVWIMAFKLNFISKLSMPHIIHREGLDRGSSCLDKSANVYKD